MQLYYAIYKVQCEMRTNFYRQISERRHVNKLTKSYRTQLIDD